MARPSKLDDALTEQIANRIRAGNYAETAVQASRISLPTYYRWMQRGADDAPCVKDGVWGGCDTNDHPAGTCPGNLEFRESVEEAEAQSEMLVVSYVQKALQTNPAVAMQYLAIRFRKRWQSEQKIALEHKGGAGLPFTIVIMPNERPQSGIDALNAIVPGSGFMRALRVERNR